MKDTRAARLQLLDYLRRETQRGPRYFKAKRIGEALGLSSREVGALLSMLSSDCDGLRIEKWSHSNSATWRVESRPALSLANRGWLPPSPATEP